MKDVKPLGKKARAKASFPQSKIKRRSPATVASIISPSPKNQNPFDPRLYRQIASGKATIDKAIDLHGHTEEHAFMRLISSIEAAWGHGNRRLLVITGKGLGGNGAIRAALPKWLSSPKLTPYVSTFDYAHPRHGGDGAFYVILRKNR